MNGPDALRAYFGELTPAAPSTVSGMVELLGGGDITKGRTHLAIAIAGTSDKKSKEYKAARRNVERYMASEGKAPKGGKQSRANPININKAVGAAQRELTKQAIDQKGLRGKPISPNIGGDVAVFGNEEYEGYRDVYAVDNEIDPAELNDFWDDLIDGDYEGAWDKLEDSVFEHYDLQDSYFTDIDSFDLGLGDLDGLEDVGE